MDAHVIDNTTMNGVCIDWFEFSLKVKGIFGSDAQFRYMVDFLGLGDKNLSWNPGWAQNGYKSCMMFENIFILFDASQSDMGIHCRMSGQGCRSFEKYSCLKFKDLFKKVIDFDTSSEGLYLFGNSTVSRIDIAYDDFEGLIDLKSIADAALHPLDCIVSKWKKAFVLLGTNLNSGEIAYTINFGVRNSDKFLTIYDKFQERKSKELMPDVDIWNRAELKLRKDSAWNFVKLNVEGKSIIELYFLVLNNQLRIVEKSDTDINRWRWKMAEHWERFACSVLDGRISLYSAPSDDYSEQKLENFVIGTCGAAIYTYCKCFSIYDLLKKIDDKKYKLATKYVELLEAPKEVDIYEPEQC